MFVLKGCAVLHVYRWEDPLGRVRHVLLAGENHGTPGDPVSFVRSFRLRFPTVPISVLVESSVSPRSRTGTAGFASPDSNVISFRKPPLAACRFREECRHLGERVRVFPVDLRSSSYFLALTRDALRRDGDTGSAAMAVLRAVLDVSLFRRDPARYEDTIMGRLRRGNFGPWRRGEKDHRHLMRSLRALDDRAADRWCAVAARRCVSVCGGIMELETALRVFRILHGSGGIVIVFCGRNHVDGLAEMFRETPVLGEHRLVGDPVILRPASRETIRVPVGVFR